MVGDGAAHAQKQRIGKQGQREVHGRGLSQDQQGAGGKKHAHQGDAPDGAQRGDGGQVHVRGQRGKRCKQYDQDEIVQCFFRKSKTAGRKFTGRRGL